MDWEPQEPFSKDDFVKFVKEIEKFLPTEPRLIQSLLDNKLNPIEMRRMWIHVYSRLKRDNVVNMDFLIYEMSVFYRFYYCYKAVESLNENVLKKQMTLNDLRQHLIMAKYDCETEYLYRYMHINPHKTIKTLLKLHYEQIDRLTGLNYKTTTIDQL